MRGEIPIKKGKYAACAAALLLLAAGIAGGGLLWAKSAKKISDGVSVSGLSVGCMTKKEAASALQRAFDPESHEIVLLLPEQEIRLDQSELNIELNYRGLLQDALDVQGEEVQDISLAPYLSLDDAALYSTLEQIAQQLEHSAKETSAVLVGDIPELSEEAYTTDAAFPVLSVTLGTPNYEMDVSAAYDAVFDGLSRGQYEIDLTGVLTALGSVEANAAEILQEISIAPVDAKVDMQAKTAIPASYGMGCDEDELDALLKEALPGETVSIQLKAIEPEIMGQEVYFQDVLGFAQTPHSTNEKRNTNLKLACASLNGVVLQPGETISYNATLGQRTKEAGYQEAPAYSGTELVDSLGGGICQVSSTLYLSSLYAELETVERVNHGYPASYMPVGLDATVSWGSPDLKIKNSTDYPVKIVAETDDEFVYVWIMGVETRDYYVRMAFGSSSDGYARSYYCRYDNETDELLSKESAALSGYLKINVATSGEIGSEEAYINGNIREQPERTPSEQALEAAKEYKEPNQNG